MAVNDKESTSRLREASLYFDELLKKMSSREEMRIEDAEMGSMLKEAAYAAAFFTRSSDNELIDKKLRDNGIITPDAVPSGISSEDVKGMCISYMKGRREFGRYGIEQARRVCDALVNYVKVLEKEKKTR